MIGKFDYETLGALITWPNHITRRKALYLMTIAKSENIIC